MADIEDVCACLASTVSDLVYPNGTSDASALGMPVQVSQGWPLEQTIEAIAARPGVTPQTPPFTLVSIYPVPGTTADGGTVMDFSPGLVSETPPGITVAVDTDEDTVTFAGLAQGGEVPTIILNRGTVYSRSCVADDTAEVVAAALAQDIQADFPSSAWTPGTGTIQIVGPYTISARVGCKGIFGRKVHRQKTQIRIVIWSSNPADRKTVAAAVDTAIKAKVQFVMPDMTIAVVTYQGTNLSDNMERPGIFRRDLIFSALFDTLEEVQAVEVTAVGFQTTVPGGVFSSSS